MSILLKSIKFFLISILAVFSLIVAIFFVDATDIDRHYINRATIEINYDNLNSRHSKKVSNFVKQKYFSFNEFFFKKEFDKRWSIESKKERSKLPKQKILKAKDKNFSDPLYDLLDYNNSNNWHRSHGNYFSTRFSSLSQITPININKLKLSWVYEANDVSGTPKENQANPIFDNNKIYLPDVHNKVVALNGKTGSKIWEYTVEDGIAAKRGLILWKKNKDDEEGKIFFTNNRKYLYGINSKNGKPISKFGKNGKVKVGLTALPPVIYNNQLILITTDSVIKSFDINNGKINWKYKINKTKNNILWSNFAKGSPWGGLSLDIKRGYLFFTTGNPESYHVGIYREGDNLYANSLVAFDLNKKKIAWHFQEIPHDVWNYDLAAPPILTMIKRKNKLVDVVVAVSKLGNVIMLDRETGENIFEIIYERAPTSNIPGERTSPYQIKIKKPEKICKSRFDINHLTDFDAEFKDEFKREINDYNFGYPAPPLLGKKNISIGGCVTWAGGSVDSNKNILYLTSFASSEIITIEKDNENRLSYYHEWDSFVDNNGFLGIKPPWGAVTALNLNNGKIIWQKPFGTIKELEDKNIFQTGSVSRAGLTATSGNIIFASGTEDNLFRAINSKTGEELWSYKMESAGSAPPTIYEVKGKQYVLVPAYERNGNKVYSFTLE